MFIVRDEATRNFRGLYVVFEGPDGAGKSTLSQLFVEALRKAYAPQFGGGEVFHQVFPSKDGPVGQLIRKAFTKDIDLSEETLAYLMMADGIDRCDELNKILGAGGTVVCDRHPLISGWAYQTEVLAIDELLAIQQRHRFLEPDIVFVLDVPPSVAVERIKKCHELTNLVFEKDDDGYRKRLRSRYSGYVMLNPNSFLLDGTRSPEELLKTCIDLVRANFMEQKKG